MEKVVYLILSRQKDSFHIIYAGHCEKTSDEKFFTTHPNFQCWTKSCSENSLYLAILPMFESDNDTREKILSRVITRYHPVCNVETKNNKPEYKIRSKPDLQNTLTKTPCPCCGSMMKIDRVLENITVIRCSECGLSDTQTNS